MQLSFLVNKLTSYFVYCCKIECELKLLRCPKDLFIRHNAKLMFVEGGWLKPE